MKFSRKTTILIWVLALLPLAATAVLYRRLPEQIPGQWGLDGSVRYDQRQRSGESRCFLRSLPF